MPTFIQNKKANFKRVQVIGFFLLLPFISSSQIVFTDISHTIPGFELTEVVTQSLAWGDYDNDGDEDLYLTTSASNRLFKNDGNGGFTDVTLATNTGHTEHNDGVSFADFDNDGDLDLYMVSHATELDALYRNNGPIGANGEYTFTKMNSAVIGLNDETGVRGMTIIDYDSDGLLDIYVNSFGADILYHNLGNLNFESVASSVGINALGFGVGAVATDLNNDGLLDLFSGNRSSDINEVYLNNGNGFTNTSSGNGIDSVGLGMGVISFDYDNDLDMDLYWTTWPGDTEPFVSNAFYQNQGNGSLFNEISAATGTQDTTGWGISANVGDIDLDGFEDFFVTNGFDPDSTENVLFHNQAGEKFTNISSVLGNQVYDGRGVAFADIDHDGDLDLCITAGAGFPNKLYRNDTVITNNWISFHLVGTDSNKSAIGARIEVKTELSHYAKEVSGGAGRGSFNSLAVEFGLASAQEIQMISIQWPSGWKQYLATSSIQHNQYHTIIEPLDSIFENSFD